MNRFRRVFFIFSGSILVCLFLCITFNPANKKTVISRNILFLTNPVMNFCGKVQKVEKEAFWLARTVYTQEKLSAPLKENTLIYKVTVGEQTKMQYLHTAVPYIFKAKSETKPAYLEPDMSKIGIGQVVNVTSRDDLRRYPKNTFVAEFIYLPPVVNSVSGIISQAQPNGLRLKTLLPPKLPFTAADNREEGRPRYPREMVYTVQINPDTEISYWDNANPDQPKPVKFDFSKLTVGLPVVVYTDADVYQTDTITALLIQPQAELVLRKNDKGGVLPPVTP